MIHKKIIICLAFFKVALERKFDIYEKVEAVEMGNQTNLISYHIDD